MPKENRIRKKDIEIAKSQIKLIVDEIFDNKDLMVNMIDLKAFDDYTYYLGKCGGFIHCSWCRTVSVRMSYVF